MLVLVLLLETLALRLLRNRLISVGLLGRLPRIRLPDREAVKDEAQAFKPGNQYPRKCALKGRQTYVSVSLPALFQMEARSAALTGKFSFFDLPRPKGQAIDL